MLKFYLLKCAKPVLAMKCDSISSDRALTKKAKNSQGLHTISVSSSATFKHWCKMLFCFLNIKLLSLDTDCPFSKLKDLFSMGRHC